MSTKTKTKKKIVVINLGDVRDTDWTDTAGLGLEMMKKIKDAGFEPTAEAPYLPDSSLLGEGGDVPLLIMVTMEDSPNKIKKNIEILESIVGDDANVDALDQDEWDKICSGE